jgi:hypothetical protein
MSKAVAFGGAADHSLGLAIATSRRWTDQSKTSSH